MAMVMEVSFAVGWRMKWRRWRVESTIAMLKSVGCKGGLLVSSVMLLLEEGQGDIPMPIS